MNSLPITLRQSYGRLAIFASALCFYLATVAVRWAKTAGLSIDSSYFVFFRFVVGFFVISSLFFVKKQLPHPHRVDLIVGRVLFNIIAVLCFFKAVELTTAAESNILNMTYPLFVTLLSWFVFKEQRDLKAIGMVLLAFCGIVLIFSPGQFSIELSNLWGLASGMLAGLSMLYLNLVRQHNDTDTVLFFVFALGTVSIYVLFRQHLHIPNRQELLYLGFSGIMGLAGQYLVTIGFRYVSAVEGSIISSTRILTAAFLGPYITSDPFLTWTGWIGALLILGANIYFILRKSNP